MASLLWVKQLPFLRNAAKSTRFRSGRWNQKRQDDSMPAWAVVAQADNLPG